MKGGNDASPGIPDPAGAGASVLALPRENAAAATATAALRRTGDEAGAEWNTKHLTLRLAADAIGAAAAAILVAPVIYIIDRSIIENASGARTLGCSIRASVANLILRPGAIFLGRPFGLVVALYGGTYLAANAVDTAAATTRRLPASHVTAGATKFAASSAANIGLCIYKDQAFVRIFGAVAAASRPVPLGSYALFALRDCLTIFASFNVPPVLGPHLSALLTEEARARVSGHALAQFAAPAAAQLFSTPLHLLGLDLYNRPSSGTGGIGIGAAAVTARDRWAVVRRTWAVSVAARMCRIVPAFGVGGVVNTSIRKGLMTRLE